LAGVLLTPGSGDILYPKEDDMTDQIKDHVVLFERRFHDLGKWPTTIKQGTEIRMTKAQYRLMKGSDPDGVQLVEVSAPPGVLERIFAAAQAEKDAEKEAELVKEFPGGREVEDWQPIGCYKAQLSKNGGMDE
jgi:hypothetical protein